MACVIVEVVAANMGLVAPVHGFIEGLRRACDEAGALLIFDEVITGFRLGPGGASAWSGVRPDLWCFGKVIGGGLPVGAFGGRADVLAVLAPDGPVYQAGTLSGNPLATAAGLAVLEAVGPADYADLSTGPPVSPPVWRRPSGRPASRCGAGEGTPGRPLLRRRPGHRLRRARRGGGGATASTPASSAPCSTGVWLSPPAPTR